jgi:hypothetical protein
MVLSFISYVNERAAFFVLIFYFQKRYFSIKFVKKKKGLFQIYTTNKQIFQLTENNKDGKFCDKINLLPLNFGFSP